MNFEKHTPGPWDLMDRGYTYIVSGGLGFITRDVCRMDASTMAAFEQDANARLITAAPDLFGLLYEVQQQCLFADDDGGIGVSEDVVIPSDMFDRICAALNKARGRQS